MPELPEVETMVRGLRPVLVGEIISKLAVHDPFLLHGCTKEELERRGRGAKVTGVERRGKWVAIAFGSDRGLIVIQPRMTGGFWLVPPDRPDHVRMTFHIKGSGKAIWFCDIRRLGKIAWYASPEDASAIFDRSHGPDALVIKAEDLFVRLTKTSRAVKPALLDQKILAGVGNIYADEILFVSRIHPERPASSLNQNEVGRIHIAIKDVLKRAILAEGSSFDAGYRTVLGLEGGFLAENAMYGHGGKPCKMCGTTIIKTKIAGLISRPTHFCPTCQPAVKP